ncbi:MAG: hypothetical protein KH355_02285 [Clostridiales bacterium]|nr:hypothetical protein [Clostridiales bacterium]
MEKNIEILGAYEREFDKRKFIHYKEDDKEYLTDGVIRHDKDISKITSIMNKMDKLPIEEIKEKNILKETEGVIKALEQLEKENGEEKKVEKVNVAIESTLDLSEEQSKEEKEENKQNTGNKEVEEVKNQLDKMYKEFEKSVINYLNETTISLDKTLFQKSMDNIRSSYDSMINVVEGKGPDKETSLVKESKGKESSLKKQMESYKTNVREIMGYMKQYHHNNSIYTQAGRVNIAKDLTDALNQVEKAMNHVTTILQQLPTQGLHKEKGIMEKNIDSFTDVSMELYKNHGNFNCTMAYIKEYAKENGMSMSQDVLKNSNLESKFKANAREEIRGIFTQAVNIGDRQYLASVIKEAGFKPSNNLIDAMKNVNQHFGKDHSVKELKNLSQNQKNLLGNDKAVVKNAVDTFKHEESIMCKVKAILPGQ